MSSLLEKETCSAMITCTLPKTNDMTMENPPFEDVFPTENEDSPVSC